MAADVSERQIGRHLELLFGQAIDENPGLHFCVFTIPSLTPRFFGDLKPAVSYCAEQAMAKQNVYVAMGLQRGPFASGQRGDASRVQAISCLWADVDVLDPSAHKGKRYVKTYDEALAVASIGGLSPSYTVSSGYGLHAYYVLDEPLVFGSDQDRHDAHVMVQRFVATVRANAEAAGGTVDGVHDLARVLRVAGTLNWKNADPREVRLVEPERLVRYSLAAIDERCVASEFADPNRAISSAAVAPFVINPDVVINPRILEALRANADSRFKDTWTMSRSDIKDQSPSAYEMALCNMFVDAEYSDQEIVDMLVYWRRTEVKKPKNRVDYYQRTIAKVRGGKETRAAVSEFTSSGEMPDASSPAMMSSGTRVSILNNLRAALGIRISGFVQLNDDGAEYFVRLESGEEFSVGHVDAITRFDRFSNRILERCNVMIPRESSKHWDSIVQRLFAIVEKRENDGPRSEIRIRNLIGQYLEEVRVYRLEEKDAAIADRYPFREDGRVWVNREHFMRWLSMGRVSQVKPEVVERDFHLLRLESRRASCTTNRRRHRAYYWGLTVDDYADILPDSPAPGGGGFGDGGAESGQDASGGVGGLSGRPAASGGDSGGPGGGNGHGGGGSHRGGSVPGGRGAAASPDFGGDL